MTFPLRLDAGLGRFHRLTREEEIAQSVRVILTTRRGERPLRPGFGTDLDRFAFEAMNNTTQNLIRREAADSLSEWEPRIEEIQISFEQKPEEGALLVNVSYKIARSGQTGQVTVPVAAR